MFRRQDRSIRCRIGLSDHSNKSRARLHAVRNAMLCCTECLATHPALGRPGRVPGTRELVVSGTPYLIPYRVHGKTVEILRVFHGARKSPEMV